MINILEMEIILLFVERMADSSSQYCDQLCAIITDDVNSLIKDCSYALCEKNTLRVRLSFTVNVH
jgi:hypothetical protein